MNNIIHKLSYKYVYLIIVLVLVSQFIIFRDLPFFWDAISKSYRAQYIFDNNFNSLILPSNIGSGHPPFWILLLATFWSVFGKTLFASRLLLLLVNVAVFYQIVELGKYFLPKSAPIFLVVLLFIEPSIIALSTSLNNDMLLFFFTLLSFNAMVQRKPFILFLAVTGLMFSNLRGLYLLLALLISNYYYLRFDLIPKKLKIKTAYISAIILFLLYCIYHYFKLGWAIITPNEGYNSQRQVAEGSLFIKNGIVFIKSFLEYGRFIVFVIIIPLVIKYFKLHKWNLKQNITLSVILISFIVYSLVLCLGMVPFTNPIGGRYFIMCYLLAIVLMIQLLYEFNIKSRKIILLVVVLFLVSGHFWVYKPTVSQSWDSTLAYLNYYPIERNMENFIKENPINKNDIGTRIPLNSRMNSELISFNSDDSYADFDIKTNKFILLSNIENRTKDKEFIEVSSNWNQIKTWNQLGVFITLYKRP